MRIRSGGALLVLSLATFVFVTAESLPIGLLASISSGVQVSQASVGLLVTGYAGVVVVATIPLTRLTQRMPRKVLMAVLLGVFVLGTALCAASGSYLELLLARLVVALAQALFWAIVSPAAASVVSEAVQGRAVALVNAGSALGPVLGVPAGTWVGQVAGWRSAFLLLAVLGAVTFVGILLALPSTHGAEQGVGLGVRPDRVRFMVTVAITALAVTGAYSAFTYVTPFLSSVTGLPASADGPVLLLRGVAGFAGVAIVGLVIDRAPWVTTLAIVALQLVALLVQWSAGSAPVVAVSAVVVAGSTLSALAGANGARILRYAPGSTATASAAVSTAFNIGIMLGALAGSLAEASSSVASVPLIGAAVTALAVALIATEPALARRQQGTTDSELSVVVES